MTAGALTLYELDRPKLKALSAELKELLYEDDRAGLARLLELGEALARTLDDAVRVVDLLLMPEGHPHAGPLLSSLRRVSKKRALTAVLTSSSGALDARLRAYAPLREHRGAAELVDKLTRSARLPWYLRRAGSTCGWLDRLERQALAKALRELGRDLTPELRELAGGLEEIDGDAVLHDGL